VFPAARIGDPITHDQVATSGLIGPPQAAPNVLIEGLPAATVADYVTCSGAATGGPVHQPAVPTPDPIILGSPTVLIGSRPAARWTPSGDISACGAPLGDAKLSPLRTVMIGGGTFPFSVTILPDGLIQVGDRMLIQGTPAFQAQALADLIALAGMRSGRALLDSIESSNHTVTITDCAAGDDSASDGPNWADPNLTDGTGTDAFVQYNTRRTPMYNNGSDWDNPPTVVTLGHELSHASHITNGNLPGDPTSGPSVPSDPVSGLPMNRALEERRTVGAGANATYNLPDYSGQPFSENAIRQDLGEPLRTSYLDPAIGMW